MLPGMIACCACEWVLMGATAHQLEVFRWHQLYKGVHVTVMNTMIQPVFMLLYAPNRLLLKDGREVAEVKEEGKEFQKVLHGSVSAAGSHFSQ